MNIRIYMKAFMPGWLARGHGVVLVTDARGAKIPGLFDDVPVHILPAGRTGGGPIAWMKAGCPSCRPQPKRFLWR